MCSCRFLFCPVGVLTFWVLPITSSRFFRFCFVLLFFSPVFVFVVDKPAEQTQLNGRLRYLPATWWCIVSALTSLFKRGRTLCRSIMIGGGQPYKSNNSLSFQFAKIFGNCHYSSHFNVRKYLLVPYYQPSRATGVVSQFGIIMYYNRYLFDWLFVCLEL